MAAPLPRYCCEMFYGRQFKSFMGINRLLQVLCPTRAFEGQVQRAMDSSMIRGADGSVGRRRSIRDGQLLSIGIAPEFTLQHEATIKRKVHVEKCKSTCGLRFYLLGG